jgi:hypothetical protein
MKAEAIVSDANAAASATQEAADNVKALADAHIANLAAARDAIMAETTALEERATAARDYLANLKG